MDSTASQMHLITKCHIIPQRESLYKSTRAIKVGLMGGNESYDSGGLIKPSFMFERAPWSLPSILNPVRQKEQNNRSLYKNAIDLDSWIIILVLVFHLFLGDKCAPILNYFTVTATGK